MNEGRRKGGREGGREERPRGVGEPVGKGKRRDRGPPRDRTMDDGTRKRGVRKSNR